MIAYVRGSVASVGAGSAVVDVGGIGLELQCAPGTLAELRVGHPTTLAATLVVREDSLTLYGFADDDERSVFELLQTVTGVGPRLAQSVLAALTPDALRRAVATEDLTALTRVSGVGRKGAQRLVLELKDRLGAPTGEVVDLGSSAAAGPAWESQVRDALIGLGWSPREADAAVAAVAADVAPDADVATVLRLALRSLDRA
ncbi:MAG: Holliday junction branch migration protein RuvA [Actinomycetales bacterium]|nr:Holliday junction branch migration protein RuvA [Actinomycetales bacterium]